MILLQVALWAAAAFLAFASIAAGANKIIRGKAELEQSMPWATEFTSRQLALIGGVEILGAIGLILPELTGIAPILTPLAALGLAVLQALALRLHVSRQESKYYPVNVLLIALALFVAVGRFFVHS